MKCEYLHPLLFVSSFEKRLALLQRHGALHCRTEAQVPCFCLSERTQSPLRSAEHLIRQNLSEIHELLMRVSYSEDIGFGFREKEHSVKSFRLLRAHMLVFTL